MQTEEYTDFATVCTVSATSLVLQACGNLPVGRSGEGTVAHGKSLSALRVEVPAFGEALDRQRARALELLRRLVDCAEPGASDDVVEDITADGGSGAAIEFLDRLRESAETAIDEARGQHSSQQVAVIQGQLLESSASRRGGGGNGASINIKRAPVAKAMAKPQERFEDVIDNSREVAATLKPAQAARLPAYRAAQVAPALPPAAFVPLDDVECAYVDTPAQLMDMLDYMEGTGTAGTLGDDAAIRLPRNATTGASPVAELAIDLEAHSLRSFAGFCCLVQLSTRRRDFLVDAIALRAELRLLNRVTAHPGIVKVLHGCDSDVLWLQRDFGVTLVNVFDTGQAARVLAYPSFGLAHLLSRFAGVTANKEYQTADWRERPLPAEMLKYAREDTHYLLPIYDRLKNELIDGSATTTPLSTTAGDSSNSASKTTQLDVPNLLAAVLARSAEKAAVVYTKERFSRRAYRRLMVKLGLSPTTEPDDTAGRRGDSSEPGNAIANDDDESGSENAPASPRTRVFAALFDWRDATARAEDESTHYVLPNRLLARLAEAAPSNVDQLVRACNPMPPLVRARAGEVVAVICRASAGNSGAADTTTKRTRETTAADIPPGMGKRKRAVHSSAPLHPEVIGNAFPLSDGAGTAPPGGWLRAPSLDGARVTRCVAVAAASAGNSNNGRQLGGSAAAAFHDVGALGSFSTGRPLTTAQCFAAEDDVVMTNAAAEISMTDSFGAILREMRGASLFSLLGVRQKTTPMPAEPSSSHPTVDVASVLLPPVSAAAASVVAPANPDLLAAVAHDGSDSTGVLSLSQRFKKRKVDVSKQQTGDESTAQDGHHVLDGSDGNDKSGSTHLQTSVVEQHQFDRNASRVRLDEVAPFDYGSAEIRVRDAINVERRALEQPRGRGRGGRGRGGRGSRNPYVSRGK